MTTSPRLNRLRTGVLRFTGSRACTVAVIALFIAQAAWLALSAAYSMAFDEYFHLGIIREYAQGWLPFLHNPLPGQPAPYGAVGSDPSFLYHYLMSFPYRIIQGFGGGQVAAIIGLRLIDIAFVTIGLLLTHRLFRRTGLSWRNSNYLLLLFILLPVVPFLAAQINYDTLLFPVAVAATLSAVRIVQSLSGKRLPSLARLLGFTALLIAGSLVKYAFLPLAAAAFLFVAVMYISVWRTMPVPDRSAAWDKRALRSKSNIILLLLVCLGLFLAGSRYGQNMVRYHTPTPECNQVVSLGSCLAYAPFARNYQYDQMNWPIEHDDLARYPLTWLHNMVRSLYFAVGREENDYPVANPLPLAAGFGYTIGVLGTLAALLRFRWLWRQPVYRLMICISGLYIATLFVQNLLDYLHLAVPVAIQGRYSLPVLPLVVILAVAALGSLARNYHLPRRALLILMALGLICMLEGGGILPFLLQAGPDWYWQNRAVRSVAETTRTILNPLIAGG